LKTSLAVILVILSMVLAACMPVQQMGAGMEPAAPQPEPGKVTVVDARARATPPMAESGGAFLTVLNGLDKPIRLVSAESQVAAAVELHETKEEDGVMKMIPQPEGFEIPAGGALMLMPGGKHVMFIGLEQPLMAGEELTLKLNFDGAEPIELQVPIVEMGDMEKMEHSAGGGG
jgi:copper(I)-binding protein